MKIPKEFSLLGQLYMVSYVTELVDDEGEVLWGNLDPRTCQLQILKGPEQSMQHVFLHELTHAILNAMGKDSLNKEEGFVDLFAGLLHQALTTGK